MKEQETLEQINEMLREKLLNMYKWKHFYQEHRNEINHNKKKRYEKLFKNINYNKKIEIFEGRSNLV